MIDNCPKGGVLEGLADRSTVVDFQKTNWIPTIWGKREVIQIIREESDIILARMELAELKIISKASATFLELGARYKAPQYSSSVLVYRLPEFYARRANWGYTGAIIVIITQDD